jgi:hypothetical protein
MRGSDFESCDTHADEEIVLLQWGVEAGRALRGFMIALRKTSL